MAWRETTMRLKHIVLLCLMGALVACTQTRVPQAVLTPDLEKLPSREVRDLHLDDTGYVRHSTIWADPQGRLWITATARVSEVPPVAGPVRITRTPEGVILDLTSCPRCRWERRRDDSPTPVLASLPILQVMKP
jgi:hypothetical protein